MSDVTQASAERSLKGRVWLEVVNRFCDAVREKNTARWEFLLKMAKDLEQEFPEEIAAEKAFWAPQTDRVTSADPLPPATDHSAAPD